MKRSSPDERPRPLAASAASAHQHVVSRQAARQICRDWQERGESVVLTNGCFDLLHVGHLRYLQAAHRLGRLIVGLNSDASVRRLKGESRPIVGADERAELLAGLRCVDLVTIFDEPDASALLEALLPDVYVKGSDYGPGGHPLPEAALADRLGIRVALVRLVEGRSTSALVDAIRRGRAAA